MSAMMFYLFLVVLVFRTSPVLLAGALIASVGVLVHMQLNLRAIMANRGSLDLWLHVFMLLLFWTIVASGLLLVPVRLLGD